MFEYWHERLPLRVFGPIALGLAAPAHIPRPSGPAAFVADVTFAVLLLAQFRLWDDLADRSADAIRHPHRVLPRRENVRNYVRLCAVLACANACIAAQRNQPELALALFGVLSVALTFAYTRTGRSAGTDLLCLAKYPVFVLLVATSRPGASLRVAAAAAALAFAVACTYELLHDRRTPLRILFRSSQ